jgi:hypothetical protein
MARWRRGSLVINPAMYRRKAPALPGLGVLAATSELFKFMLTQGAPRVLEARHFGGLVTAATMTTADAGTLVKSDITFGSPNDPQQGGSTPRIRRASPIPVRKIRP